MRFMATNLEVNSQKQGQKEFEDRIRRAVIEIVIKSVIYAPGCPYARRLG